MIINRKLLLSTISRVKSIVASRNTIDILNNFVLSAADNKLSITASNLTMEATAICECTGAIDTTADARKLYDVVSRLDGDDITITPDANHITVSHSRSRFKINTLPTSQFPRLPSAQNTEAMAIDGASLVASIRAISHAQCTNDALAFLNGISISRDGFTATDGRGRISFYVMPQDKDGIIIPSELAKQVISNVSHETSMYANKNIVEFVCDGYSIKSRLLDGTFPDVKRVLAQPLVNTLQCYTKQLIKAVSDVSVLSDAAYRRVGLRGTDNELCVLSSANGELAECHIECALSAPIDTGFDARYLLGLLGSVVCEELCIEFGAGLDPIRIKDGKATHLLAAVREN